METIKEFFSSLLTMLSSIGIIDIFDILFMTIILFLTFRFIRNRRAGKLFIGVLFLLLVQILARLFGFVTINYFLSNFFEVGIIALIILFQPELRSALEKVGSEPGKRIKFFIDKNDMQRTQAMIDNVCNASCQMAKEKTGALIVIERKTKLGEHINSGTVINADATEAMIENIFFKNAPLHDGALVIREGRLYAAGCFLPLSTNDDFKELGTRHHAAVGVSEVSDAVVIIVSEQTGTISVALDGTLRRNLDFASLKSFLNAVLVKSSEYKSLKKHKKQSDTKKQDAGSDN